MSRPRLAGPRARSHRAHRRRGQARAGRGRHGDPRAGDAPPAHRGWPADRRRWPRPLPARRRRAGHRRRAAVVHALRPRRQPARRPRRGSRPFRAGLIRAEDARPSDRRDAPRELDRLRRVRPPGRRPPAHRLPRDGVLDQRRHRGTGLRRVAPLHGPHQLEEAGRVGRVHRARRAADGRDDAAVPVGSGRPHRATDVDLHDHRDRQLPLLARTRART